MKFSYQWIQEMVPGLETSPDELRRLITMKTAECEGIEPVGEHFQSVVAAKVLSVAPLPDSKNQRVVIDIGNSETRTVVCGAPNVRVGMVAAYVPPGTSLGDKRIERAVIGDIESEGMLASAAELGISRDHIGLLELQQIPGTKLDGAQPDWIIEIDNKSLTHRPDLWGHHGMAREVAAITGKSLVDPVHVQDLPQGKKAIEVSIEDFQLCPRYSALVLENVKVQPSPLWLQTRLESLGLNPINNIVDVTNYILTELPQPMHAFDADKLHGDTIYVRPARAGEKLHALNEEEYELASTDLVIADGAGPIALAGVIGGTDSAISENTKRIVLESACFHPTSVRLTAARLKARTDASMRFEKSLDPENTLRGLARAVTLLKEVSPGIRLVGGVTDKRGPYERPAPVTLPVEFVNRKLGKQLSQEEIGHILTALGFGLTMKSPGVFEVNIPSWRGTKDISLKDDLVEEVGRMIGYDEIAPTPPHVASAVPSANSMREYLRRVRLALAAQGFTETSNYSFVNEEQVKRFGFDIETHLALKNPIAADLTHMRQSLLPRVFSNIVSNTRHFPEFRLFEIGREVHRASGSRELPSEKTHCVAALYGVAGDEQDFFEVKRITECLFPQAFLQAAEPRTYEHPTRTAEVHWHGQAIGRLFELHPSLLHDAGIEGRAILLDVDLDLAESLHRSQEKKFMPLRKYPTSGFDLSVVTDTHEPVAKIESELVRLAADSLASIEFVRQYAGPPLPEDKKSVSYHLEVGALDRTLSSEGVTTIRNTIIDGMRALGYELRV